MARELETGVVGEPPWSITDEDHVCARCGYNVTGCELCIGDPVAVIYSPPKKRLRHDD